MSVSLALVPAVLLLRVAMGKNKFDNWVESSQIKMPTSFKDEKELVITVKKAGYDANKYGSLIKTHVNGEKQFFFWEKINGVWTAIFSKYDSEEMIRSFIFNLEKCAGKKLIYNSLQEISSVNEKPRAISEIPPIPRVNKEVFPTNFIDKELLLKTLKDYCVSPIELSDGDIQCNVENCILTFRKEGEGNYDVEVKGTVSLKGAYEQLAIIDEEYKQNVQAYTYEKVVKKLKESSMHIENEEIMDDNSILLTINIGG